MSFTDDTNKASKAFLNKTDLIFDLTKKEDDEAAISELDDKVSILLKYQSRKYLNQTSYLKSDFKSTEKEVSKENEEKASKDISSIFKKSEYDFSDKKKQFINPFAECFRLLGKDALGNEIFSSAAVTIQTKLAGKAVSEFKPIGKVTDVRDNKEFDTTTIREKDKYNKANEKRKLDKRNISKKQKKAARLAAASNVLRAKKITQNQLGNMSGEVSGDLLKDGAGFLQMMLQKLKEAIMVKVKAAVISAVTFFGGFLVSILSAIAPFAVIIITVVIIITSVFSVFTEDVDVPAGDGYTYAALSEEQIGEIIENLYLLYEDMSYEQQILLEYALSKVGCAYNQNYHWSLTEDIFDCSSLAYRSYLEVGINISNEGIYSAAEECRMAVNGMHLVMDELMPGDLIFYGGSDNGRYMGVYHVAIYVGSGKMVEARGTNWGVVYCDARTTNAVAYGRYL